MHKVTVSLADRHLYELKAREYLDDTTSRSEALRQILDEYEELHTEYEQLHTECEHLRAEIDDLETELDRVRDEKRLILQEREEKAELVRYVEDERTAEQRWREAGLGTRLRWRVFGMPSDDADE